jgi:hypothetical protein
MAISKRPSLAKSMTGITRITERCAEQKLDSALASATHGTRCSAQQTYRHLLGIED